MNNKMEETINIFTIRSIGGRIDGRTRSKENSVRNYKFAELKSCRGESDDLPVLEICNCERILLTRSRDCISSFVKKIFVIGVIEGLCLYGKRVLGTLSVYTPSTNPKDSILILLVFHLTDAGR